MEVCEESVIDFVLNCHEKKDDTFEDARRNALIRIGYELNANAKNMNSPEITSPVKIEIKQQNELSLLKIKSIIENYNPPTVMKQFEPPKEDYSETDKKLIEKVKGIDHRNWDLSIHLQAENDSLKEEILRHNKRMYHYEEHLCGNG